MKLERTQRFSIGFLILLLPLLSAEVSAQGGYAGAFLRLGVGARAKAVGDAHVALARGAEASYYNPAGLPLLTNSEVLASYRALALDRQFTFMGLAIPISPKLESGRLAGGLALSWIRAGVSNIDGRDSDGRATGELSNSENAFALSFALNPIPAVSLGLSVKVLWNRFPGVGIDGATISAASVGFDFGAMIRPVSWVSFGVSVRDVNSNYTWNTDKLYGEDGSEVINKFPTIFRYGLALRPPQIPRLLLLFDFEDSKQLDSRLHAGTEVTVAENLLLRAGYDDGSLTLGGGYAFGLLGKRSELNYAYVAPGDRPEEEHVFTWVFQF